MADDVAIAHWAMPADGGGERVAWELARAFDAPVYTASPNPAVTPENVEVRSILTGRPVLERLAHSSVPGVRQVALVHAWQTASELRAFDTIVTSGNEPLFFVPADGQTWVHFAHHTGRTATDRLDALSEFHTGLRGAVMEPLDHSFRAVQRYLSRSAAQKPDHIVCNSPLVADRVHSYWGVEPARTSVVYPPVDVDGLDPDAAPTGDYYLTLGRLDDHKRVDDILEAWSNLEAAGEAPKLLVAGDGSERDRLENMAPPSVEFLGYVDEARKRELLAGARAFVFAAEREDFGIAPVEALASGTPVIGVREGMTQHQVRDGQSGILWDRGYLLEAVRRFQRDGVAWGEEQIAAWAERFGADGFRAEMREVVEETRRQKRERRTPYWVEPDLPAEEPAPGASVAADGGDEP